MPSRGGRQPRRPTNRPFTRADARRVESTGSERRPARFELEGERGHGRDSKAGLRGRETRADPGAQESPNDPQAAYYLGVALHSLGDTAGARKEYADALKLDPKLTEASVNLSQLELEAKSSLRRSPTVDAGLKNAPKQPDLLLNRALILEGLGEAGRGAQGLRRGGRGAPDDAELHLAYADLLRQAGKSEEAVKELKKVQTDDPTLLAATARQFGLNKAFSDCVASLDKAIKAKSTPDLLVRRGVCRHEMKDDPGAAADYEAALKADPNFAPAHYYPRHAPPCDRQEEGDGRAREGAALAKNEGVGPAAKRELEELKKKK